MGFLQDDALLAFQIAFDLVENERQAFLLNVRNLLQTSKSPAHLGTEQSSETADHGSATLSSQNGNAGSSETDPPREAGDVQMAEGSHTPNGNAHIMSPSEAAYAEKLVKIKGILSGETLIQLTLQFLYSKNK